MKLNKIFIIPAIIFTIFVAGCKSGDSRSSYDLFEHPLDDVVDEWTRSSKVYNQLDTAIIVDVIYNSQQLRQAWVAESAMSQELSSDEESELLQKELTEEKSVAQFYLAFYTAYRKWNNLDDIESDWKIFLDTANGPVGPVSITEVKPDTLPWQSNLPFRTTFRTIYKVDFPREQAGDGPHKLVISSLLGKAELEW